jgi:hypothetical protein
MTLLTDKEVDAIEPDLLVECAQGFVGGWTKRAMEASILNRVKPLRDGLIRIYNAKCIGDARTIVVQTLGEEFIKEHRDELLADPVLALANCSATIKKGDV